jgi:hypothetical protein
MLSVAHCTTPGEDLQVEVVVVGGALLVAGHFLGYDHCLRETGDADAHYRGIQLRPQPLLGLHVSDMDT